MLLQPSSVSFLPHSVTSGPSWPKICCSSSKTSIHQRLPGYTSNWRCSCLSLMWPEFKTQRRRKTLISPRPSSFLSFPSLCYLTACKSFFSQRFRGLFIPPLSLILLLGQLALTKRSFASHSTACVWLKSDLSVLLELSIPLLIRDQFEGNDLVDPHKLGLPDLANVILHFLTNIIQMAL